MAAAPGVLLGVKGFVRRRVQMAVAVLVTHRFALTLSFHTQKIGENFGVKSFPFRLLEKIKVRSVRNDVVSALGTELPYTETDVLCLKVCLTSIDHLSLHWGTKY